MSPEQIASELFHNCAARVVLTEDPATRAEIWTALCAHINRVQRLDQGHPVSTMSEENTHAAE